MVSNLKSVLENTSFRKEINILINDLLKNSYIHYTYNEGYYYKKTENWSNTSIETKLVSVFLKIS